MEAPQFEKSDSALVAHSVRITEISEISNLQHDLNTKSVFHGLQGKSIAYSLPIVFIVFMTHFSS